jgi:hypothetical protein
LFPHADQTGPVAMLYRPDQLCVWTIQVRWRCRCRSACIHPEVFLVQAPPGHVVSGRFSHFDLYSYLFIEAFSLDSEQYYEQGDDP